jgi:hypothetical protein
VAAHCVSFFRGKVGIRCGVSVDLRGQCGQQHYVLLCSQEDGIRLVKSHQREPEKVSVSDQLL